MTARRQYEWRATCPACGGWWVISTETQDYPTGHEHCEQCGRGLMLWIQVMPAKPSITGDET